MDAEPVRLWHRTSKRGRWRLHSTHPTTADAFAAMRHGDWLIRHDDSDPNVKTQPRPTEQTR